MENDLVYYDFKCIGESPCNRILAMRKGTHDVGFKFEKGDKVRIPKVIAYVFCH